MKTSSAKNKGRRLQQWVVQQLIDWLDIDPDDIESRPMGSQGSDVILGNESRMRFPYDVECKNQERLNLWSSWEQCVTNTNKGNAPLLIIKRNGVKPLAVIDAEHFFKLQSIKEEFK